MTGMAANKTTVFSEKCVNRFWRYYDEPFSVKVCKWNGKVKQSAFIKCHIIVTTEKNLKENVKEWNITYSKVTIKLHQC